MKLNEHTALVCKDVILVPYRKEHVEKYHEWMTDPELRELTASESLTLEEEYEMQRKWQEDEDKLTFIILARLKDTSQDDLPVLNYDWKSSPMIGDVNLFLKGSPEDEDFEAEAEIMIAEKSYRRRGLASQTLQALFSYVTSHTAPPLFPISSCKLVIRIGESNFPSIRMFEKLGFVVTKRVEVFHEVELRLREEDGGMGEKLRVMWDRPEVLRYE